MGWQAKGYLLSIFVFTVIAVMSAALFAQRMFGHGTVFFSTMTESMEMLGRWSFGDFEELRKVHDVSSVASLVVWPWIFVSSFMIFNLIIAVITEAFDQVRNSAKPVQFSDREGLEYVWHSLKKKFGGHALKPARAQRADVSPDRSATKSGTVLPSTSRRQRLEHVFMASSRRCLREINRIMDDDPKKLLVDKALLKAHLSASVDSNELKSAIARLPQLACMADFEEMLKGAGVSEQRSEKLCMRFAYNMPAQLAGERLPGEVDDVLGTPTRTSRMPHTPRIQQKAARRQLLRTDSAIGLGDVSPRETYFNRHVSSLVGKTAVA